MSPPPVTPEPAALSAPPCATPATDPTQWFKREIHAHDAQLKSWLRGTFRIRDVDDVAQESYLRVWRAKAASPIQSAKAFLFMVARRVALDLVRRETRSPLETGWGLAGSRVLDTAPNAVDALLQQEILEHMASVLLDLSPRHREIIVLHKLQGLSQREVGERLGLTERTVEKYCGQALQECEARLIRRGIHGFLG